MNNKDEIWRNFIIRSKNSLFNFKFFRGILATSSEEEDNANDETGKNESEKKPDDEPDDEADEAERIRRYRELLLGSESKSKKQRKGDLEFDWEGGIKEDGFNELLFNNNNKKSQFWI